MRLATSILSSAPGTDRLGYAGLKDRTDHHWDRVFLATGLATVLDIGAEIGQSDQDDIVRAIRDGSADTVNEAGERIVDRNLDIQPTIRVRPGWQSPGHRHPRPAAGEHIDRENVIDKPCPGRDLGEIADSEPVRCGALKLWFT